MSPAPRLAGSRANARVASIIAARHPRPPGRHNASLYEEDSMNRVIKTTGLCLLRRS